MARTRSVAVRNFEYPGELEAPDMVTIESLLHRVRWDPEFGHGEITIGYYDRVERRIVTVPIRHVHLEPGHHFSFTVVTADGSVQEVPLHRVREVRRDGVSIWHRTVPTDCR